MRDKKIKKEWKWRFSWYVIVAKGKEKQKSLLLNGSVGYVTALDE
ncbi:hypothetical protein [Bacillus seohaeanensis]|uniref:Uncharacterized protein n=1 Tax=Bacillus seohaeanensis TaxID=284580 RepID=A0ABW5RVF5_9BACI